MCGLYFLAHYFYVEKNPAAAAGRKEEA